MTAKEPEAGARGPRFRKDIGTEEEQEAPKSEGRWSVGSSEEEAQAYAEQEADERFTSAIYAGKTADEANAAAKARRAEAYEEYKKERWEEPEEPPEMGLPEQVIKDLIKTSGENVRRQSGQLAQSFSYSAGRSGMPSGLIQAGMNSVIQQGEVAAANAENAITIMSEQIKHEDQWKYYQLLLSEKRADRNLDYEDYWRRRQEALQMEYARLQASSSPEIWEYILGGVVSAVGLAAGGFAGAVGTAVGSSLFTGKK